MSSSPNTILLIADISGYTRFMKQHAISIGHAKQIIVRLLKALIKAARPPLKVAELEGDAVFLYVQTSDAAIEATAQQVKEQVVNFFRTFKAELREIDALRTCSCDACVHLPDLQLKQVLHVGRVEIERIGRFEKLFGLDVILVHRLLKNSVRANEYVMMTRPMFDCMKDFYGLTPVLYNDLLEGVGRVETLVFHPHQLPLHLLTATPDREPMSVAAKLRWRWEISYKL
ncbi:MAG TPA: DUF2652 domain-containing protein, partial [Bacteroidota bacterium]|nr:DUF2652 domain-containing protein [Bacteroidota bacterium]